MQIILNVATLLGGLTTLWFLYDKRVMISNWFKLCAAESVNPLSLPDDEFIFVFDKAEYFIKGAYSPVNKQEKELCLSLTNRGLLKKKNAKFKLTGLGKRMLAGPRA